MKCPHCGSQLSIEDAYCPFCGHVNEKAKGYTTTMNLYEKELSTAQKKVEKSTHLVKSLVVFLVIAVILCIANIVLVLMNKNVYHIEKYIASKDIDWHFDEYCNTMDTLISNGDYSIFDQFYYDKNLAASSKMDSYCRLHTYVSEYNNIFFYLSTLVFDETKDSTTDKERFLTKLAWSVNYFYKMYTGGEDVYPNYEIEEKHWQTVEVLNQKLRALFSYYFSMTEQELDQMSSMSEVQIALFLGRRLNIYE